MSQPLEFVAGKPVTSDSIAKDVDAAGGLYSGIPGPKPPPVLGTAVVGMKRGGKVASHFSPCADLHRIAGTCRCKDVLSKFCTMMLG